MPEAADLSSVYMPVEEEAAPAVRRLLDRRCRRLTIRGSS